MVDLSGIILNQIYQYLSRLYQEFHESFQHWNINSDFRTT